MYMIQRTDSFVQAWDLNLLTQGSAPFTDFSVEMDKIP